MAYDSPEKYKAWVANNRARSNAIKRAWVLRNKDRDRALKRQWEIENKPAVMEKTRRYQAAKRRAVPGWANKEAMRAFYAEALRLSKETGIPHEVDHIVPLTSPIVCGLHCEANLRVVQRSVNRSKANKL
jgi:hypothetical protein